jgi:amino acid adenylation domain-containing protein
MTSARTGRAEGRDETVTNVETAALPPWSVDPAGPPGPPPALGDLLVAASLRWPDRTAINDGAAAFTFAQLEQGAGQVAAWLAGQGVAAGDRVVILTEKRAVMPVLAVAVWKCGAVYVPLDATEPPARLRALLTRLQPAAVISLDDREPPVDQGIRLGMERLTALLSGPAATHRTVAHHPEDAAYIIFGSGPTGIPTGIENSAAGLLNYFGNHNQVLRLTPDSRVLSLSPFTVDVSLEDTLLPLSLGAFVHQFRSMPAGAVIRGVLARERITHLIAVSMLLAMITADGRQLTRAKLPDLELVMTGAQVCDPAVVNIWRRQLPEVRFVHAFGPPETTVFCVSHEIAPEDPERESAYPIGRPLRGMTAKIIRDGIELRQPGLPGELWVGGDQIMRGYFDQPELTAHRTTELDGIRYFRTGDLCSYDHDGNLVFHAHEDGEISWLAGRRTHLSEIRQAALASPGVDQAFAAVVRHNNRDVVALAIVSALRQALSDVEAHLTDLLPSYQRPALLAWSPTAPATQADVPQLMQRLAAGAQQSDSRSFALLPDGAVEPIERVETCP